MKLELEVTKEMLDKLRDLHKDIDKYPFLVLSEIEEKVVKELLTMLFHQVDLNEKYEKARLVNKEELCKCGHTSDFHATKGDRLCCFVDCPCFIYEKRVVLPN